MLTDSERFAFMAWRINAFETTGNAYDAVQTDESIKKGDTLLVPSEAVVGVAHTWPFSITRDAGYLHQLIEGRTSDTLESLNAEFGVSAGTIERACKLAQMLSYHLDPGLIDLIARDAPGERT